MTRTGARNLAALPRRELLEALARCHHHLQNEHKRAHPESGIRRRIEKRQRDVRERFERLLAEWVPDGELQAAWREHLRNRSAAPAGPPAIRPLVFKGVSEAGSTVEVRGHKGEDLAVDVDGSLVERIPYDGVFAGTGLPVRFRVARATFVETFGAPEDALDALGTFLAEGGSPPWDDLQELLEDGLIDPGAALTPRGHRALAARSG